MGSGDGSALKIVGGIEGQRVRRHVRPSSNSQRGCAVLNIDQFDLIVKIPIGAVADSKRPMRSFTPPVVWIVRASLTQEQRLVDFRGGASRDGELTTNRIGTDLRRESERVQHIREACG